jgi:hypothetical protein
MIRQLFPLLALTVMALAGCTATNPGAPTPKPAATLPVIEAKPARITGSEESSAMLDSFTVFVTAVDGVPVAAGRAGWNTPVVLKAGQRRLTVAFNRGVFTAQAELTFNAHSASAYLLKFATDAQLFGKNSYCEFWIVDATTSEIMTRRVRASLTKIEPGN